MPELPTLPPICRALLTPAVSLDEALQKIDAFFSPEEERLPPKQPEQNAPALQLLQVLEETAPVAQITKATGIKREERHSPTALPAREMIEEVLRTSPKPKTEQQALPVVSEVIESSRIFSPTRIVSSPPIVSPPPIVSFDEPLSVKPVSEESVSEQPERPENSATNSPALKIASEWVMPVFFSKVFQQHWLRRRKENTQKAIPCRKPCLLPPVRVPHTEKLPASNMPTNSMPKPVIDTSACCWPQQLSSLMLTANNQMRMLADHLVVQSNQGTKTICFKGIFPGDGCSTIVLCAAKALTERGYQVLLIDAQHRHIDLPKQLNLSGNLDSGDEVLTLDDRLGFWVWQESKTAVENRKLLSGIVASQREQYDLILLDGGSVTESPLAEFVEFCHHVELDGVILVSNTKRPTEMPMPHITGRLRQHHIPLIGITENYV